MEPPAWGMSDDPVCGDGIVQIPAGSEGSSAPPLSLWGDENLPPPDDSGDLWAGSVQVLCLNSYGTRQLCWQEFYELKMVALQGSILSGLCDMKSP